MIAPLGSLKGSDSPTLIAAFCRIPDMRRDLVCDVDDLCRLARCFEIFSDHDRWFEIRDANTQMSNPGRSSHALLLGFRRPLRGYGVLVGDQFQDKAVTVRVDVLILCRRLLGTIENA